MLRFAMQSLLSVLVVSTFCVLCALPVFASSAPVSSTQFTPPVIAIVDIQRLMQQSKASQSAQSQLDAQRSKFQHSIESEENDLRAAEDALTQSRKQLSAEQFSVREQQLRERFLTVERHVQARRKVLDQAYGEGMNMVRAGILNIVESVARVHGATLVIVKQDTLWADQPIDVTEEVLTKLDQKMPSVEIKMPDDPDKRP